MNKYLLVLFILLINDAYCQLALNEGLNMLYYEDSTHASHLSYVYKNKNLIIDYKIGSNEFTDSLKELSLNEDEVSDSFSVKNPFKYPKLNLPGYNSNQFKNTILYVAGMDSLLVDSSKILLIKNAKTKLWIDFNGIEYKYQNKSIKVNDSITVNAYTSWPHIRLNSKIIIANKMFYIIDFDNPKAPENFYSITFLKNFYTVQIEINQSTQLNLILLNNNRINPNAWKNVRN